MRKSIRAGAFILNDKNQIAISNEHLWGFSRGGVEEGEDPVEAAKRESLEEVGIPAENLHYIEKVGVYERFPGGVTEDTPDPLMMEIHIFLFSTDYKGELNPTDPNVKEAIWVNIDEVGNILTNEKDKEFFENWHSRRNIEKE